MCEPCYNGYENEREYCVPYFWFSGLIFGIVFCCNRREKDKQVSQEAQITTLGETKWCYLFISIAGWCTSARS